MSYSLYGRALLADGHLDMLRGVHDLLLSLFESVVMVADEQSLRDMLDALQPALVVVDLALVTPARAGLMRRPTGERSGLAMIVLSVHDDVSVAEQMMATGAAGFVLKRTACLDLVPAVHKVLGGGSFVSPGIRRVSTTLDGEGPPRPG